MTIRPTHPLDLADVLMRAGAGITSRAMAERAGRAIGVEVRAGLMTPAEHRVVELLGEATSLFCAEVVGDGPTRSHDVNEWCGRIHDLQGRVLMAAAGRAFPELYRQQGQTVGDPDAPSHET